jgi:hypothetical protein
MAEGARDARPRREAMAMLRHASVNLDVRVVHGDTGGIGDRHAQGVHPARAERLERRHELARGGGARAGPEFGYRGARDVLPVHHHHDVAAAGRGHSGAHDQNGGESGAKTHDILLSKRPFRGRRGVPPAMSSR